MQFMNLPESVNFVAQTAADTIFDVHKTKKKKEQPKSHTHSAHPSKHEYSVSVWHLVRAHC